MSPLGIALGAAAIVAAIASWVGWARDHVSTTVFTRVVTDVLGKGDVQRARKLCYAAPHSPFVQAIAAAIDAGVRAAGRGDHERSIREAYDGTMRRLLDRTTPRLWLAMATGGLAAAAIYLLVETGTSWRVALWPAAAAVPALHGWRMGVRQARAAGAERERVVTTIAAATSADRERADT